MRILGIDPGTAKCGWGVIEKNSRGFKAHDWGVIETEKTLEQGERLSIIYDQLVRKIEKIRPTMLAVERLFFFRNQKTVINIAQAQGAILMAAWEMGLPVDMYTPMQVKLTICNDGKADKKTVQRNVRRLLKMNETPKPDDAADGLAIALCHGHRISSKVKSQKSKVA
jgi:crossover junction endodeoxyribonuclease RuvC